MSLEEKLPTLSALRELHLIWRAKEGDGEAFSKLYLKYLDGIFRYVYFKVREDKELAEDIVQETFLKSFKNLKSFRNGISFQAWLYTIARNATTDEIRKNGRLVGLSPEIQDSNGNLEDKILLKIEYQKLLKNIKELPEEQREVVTLRFINDMPYKEISRIMDKKEESLRALSHRALKKLRNKNGNGSQK